jgi:hypothetical protein
MPVIVLARILAVVYAVAAILIAMRQGEAMPVWIIGALARFEIAPELAVRLAAGVCAAVAGMLAALGHRARVAAIIAAGLLVFSGIADGSATLSLGGSLLRPIVQVLTGLLLLVPLLSSRPSDRRLRHPAMAGVGVVASIVLGAGIAANLEVGLVDTSSIARDESGRYRVHDLTPSDWEGKPLEETGILEHLPQLRGLSNDQPTLVAFYRPNCGMCHDLFDGYFGERLPARVVAVRVPPAEGVELAESDLPDDVVCDECVRLSFPEGPVWLIQTPVVVEIVDGQVTCVSSDDFQRCVDDAVAAAEAQFAAENEAAGG